MRLCLFEDRAEQLEPLSLTRPVFELRCGLTTLAHKQSRHTEQPIAGVWVRPGLADLYRQHYPEIAVNDASSARGAGLLLVNGRWLPPEHLLVFPTASCVGIVDEETAFVFLRDGHASIDSLEMLVMLMEHWQHTLPAVSAGGRMIAFPWELVDENSKEIHRDFGWLDGPCEDRGEDRLALVGPLGQLWIAPSAKIEPMVVANTMRGPVVIDEEATISAFTRLEGPCYVGPRTQVVGAKIRAGTSIGPDCRVGGEVEASIMHGSSNKYHEGFLGHAYVGEWVNLGAGTHNSDLRNDYGDIAMPVRGKLCPTGMNKVGCFIGDHTKTGLGTLLNTGTVVGAFCNLLPAGRFAPKCLPSFTSWWNGRVCEAFTLEQLLRTAEIAMSRRGVTLTDAHRTLYTGLYEASALERRRAMRDSELPNHRKIA